MGVPGWPPKTYPRPFENVAPRRGECPLSRGNSNPGGPMIFLLVEVLPNNPIHRIGGELRIFRQLQISETNRNVCQYVLNANVRERRYKSESNQARYGDHGIRQTLHEADGLCRMVVEVRFRSKDQ